jgi:hypothetical protein
MEQLDKHVLPEKATTNAEGFELSEQHESWRE